MGEGVRAIWTSWSDGGAIAHNIIANGSTNYKANFQMQYQLTSQKSPVCGGTVTPAGNWFDAGATAHVERQRSYRICVQLVFGRREQYQQCGSAFDGPAASGDRELHACTPNVPCLMCCR